MNCSFLAVHENVWKLKIQAHILQKCEWRLVDDEMIKVLLLVTMQMCDTWKVLQKHLAKYMYP
jgi:hypothetical protein